MAGRSPAPVLDRGGVKVLKWPDQADDIARLDHDAVPRLLLVDPDAPPPTACDELTDWIRLPASDIDVEARLTALRLRTQRRPEPVLDPDGILHRGDQWVGLSAIEARLAAAFLDKVGYVLRRPQLIAAGWPDAKPDERSVDARIKLLRRRVSPLGLRIHTIFRRGYLLDFDDAAA